MAAPPLYLVTAGLGLQVHGLLLVGLVDGAGSGEPYPALRCASSEFGWAGNSPAPMYNFRKVPQFPRIIFVEGSPASQIIADGASSSRSTVRGVGRWDWF